MAAGRRSADLGRRIAEQLAAAVTAPPLRGVRTPVTDRRGRLARMRALEASGGGEKAAARAAGVTPRTWRAWKAGVRPRAASLRGLQDAYERDLAARSQTPRRRREAARALTAWRASLHVGAEVQWDGYYNGEASDANPAATSDGPYPPLAGNGAAHRAVNFSANGQLDLGPLVRLWGAGAAPTTLAAELERIVSDTYSAQIFLNGYRHVPEVEINRS